MLEIKNLVYTVTDTKTGKENRIIDDISLKIDERFVAVTGPNGSGKSTLAKLIAGIYTPESGQILLDGVGITNMSITERARHGVSFAFQQPVRFKGLRVKDLLSLATGRENDTVNACKYLSEVGLCARDYLDRELNDSLSGGEMKRIEIAMTLARGTKLNIFDEPEAGIDLWSFQNLIHVFENMRKNVDAAILIISHQERILNIADHIAYLRDGRVEKYGTREEILPGLLHSVDDAACRVLTEKMEVPNHA